jgi:hypothetical protein
MNENKITAAILAVAANSVRESPNTYNIADEQKMVMESYRAFLRMLQTDDIHPKKH